MTAPVHSHPDGPTQPSDYAALEAVFTAALASVIILARRKKKNGEAGIPNSELATMALATFALADLLAKEKVSTWIREPFVAESDDHRPLHPEGEGMRRVIGELLTCTRCVGTWSALGLVGLRTASPKAGQITNTVLALTGANHFLQSGFRLLTEKCNQESKNRKP